MAKMSVQQLVELLKNEDPALEINVEDENEGGLYVPKLQRHSATANTKAFVTIAPDYRHPADGKD